MKNTITTLIALVMLVVSTSANAQGFSITPMLDELELKTGIKSVPELNQNTDQVQYDFKWDDEAPFLVSLGVLAVCVTVIVIATTASGKENADSSNPALMNVR